MGHKSFQNILEAFTGVVRIDENDIFCYIVDRKVLQGWNLAQNLRGIHAEDTLICQRYGLSSRAEFQGRQDAFRRYEEVGFGLKTNAIELPTGAIIELVYRDS